MSSKALLDKLYSGLDTMPAVETELSARDLRRLTDDFLGKPAEPSEFGQHRAPPSAPAPTPSAVKARSGTRGTMLRSSLLALVSIALAGVIAAATLRESDKRAAVPPPPPAVDPVPAPAPEVQPAPSPPPEPVVLVNPFDASEKFTFPPGTSKADARDQMAALLLQRAVERRAHIPRARKLAAEPHAPSTRRGS
ncbi:MAG TPA: hypothetical protein VJQ52_18150 [Steroidobacteraceae bacterium]|nr:hypothetical protein [Steroidobacteraceae bacterium]